MQARHQPGCVTARGKTMKKPETLGSDSGASHGSAYGELFEYGWHGRVVVRARSSDPETSHAAAAEFEGNQTKAQKCVKIAAQILQEKGHLTDFEIRDVWADYWGNDAWSFTLPCKARHWARQAGLVKHVGFGIHHGRKVRKWGIGCDTEFLDAQHKCPTCGKPCKPNRRLGQTHNTT